MATPLSVAPVRMPIVRGSATPIVLRSAIHGIIFFRSKRVTVRQNRSHRFGVPEAGVAAGVLTGSVVVIQSLPADAGMPFPQKPKWPIGAMSNADARRGFNLEFVACLPLANLERRPVQSMAILRPRDSQCLGQLSGAV